ncbi:hypothetical protein L0337_01485 [candidate division KSB1 bacterium]|nr:hypothetical protein [candidate division KSB1 bacterium]
MRRALIVGIDHLDCCHSGALGLIPALQSEQVHLREGVSMKYALDQKKPGVHINPITRHVSEI